MLNDEIIHIIPKIQQYFVSQPIAEAYLVGSCSRGEENDDSDMDFLVRYVDSDTISLLTIGGIISDLEKITNRSVDLIEEDFLLPFAKETVERDKIKIYERAN